MKIGWDSIPWLVNDAIRKDKASGQQQNLPERLVAHVKEAKTELALLRWEGKTFTARIDVPVKKGEYLMLQFKGMKEGKFFYRVLARSFEPIIQEGSRYPTQHMLVQNSYGIPYPLLYRYYEDREERQEEEKAETETKEVVVLDFAVETQNFGLIIVRISRKHGVYYLHLLAESEDQGKDLHEALDEIQKILFLVLHEVQVNVRIKPWELITPVEKKEILGDLFKVSHVLDERV